MLKCWIPLSKLKPITTKYSLLFRTFLKNTVRPILPCVSEANILPKAMGTICWRLVWFVERSTYRVSGLGLQISIYNENCLGSGDVQGRREIIEQKIIRKFCLQSWFKDGLYIFCIANIFVQIYWNRLRFSFPAKF